MQRFSSGVHARKVIISRRKWGEGAQLQFNICTIAAVGFRVCESVLRELDG